MNKHDRAKMFKRLEMALPWMFDNAVRVHNTVRFVGLEVDRAVRAERRAQDDTEKLRLAQRKRLGTD